MQNPILKQLEKKRDRERYEVIKKRWEIERLKTEIERVKGATNEVCESKA